MVYIKHLDIVAFNKEDNRTNETNNERVSVFILKLSKDEKKQIKTTVEWKCLSDAARMAKEDSAGCASAFRQLFAHDDTFNRIVKLINHGLEGVA